MLMTELFAATWSDSPVTPQPDSRYENAAAFTVFDPLAFTTREAHEARIEALETYLDETAYVDAVDTGPGTKSDRALLPGRPEHETRVAYERDGIPVPERIRTELASYAREQGLETAVVDEVDPA
jgi:LDH2 family malate/lactate/ureidoglycolate dehydrogenase